MDVNLKEIWVRLRQPHINGILYPVAYFPRIGWMFFVCSDHRPLENLKQCHKEMKCLKIWYIIYSNIIFRVFTRREKGNIIGKPVLEYLENKDVVQIDNLIELHAIRRSKVEFELKSAKQTNVTVIIPLRFWRKKINDICFKKIWFRNNKKSAWLLWSRRGGTNESNVKIILLLQKYRKVDKDVEKRKSGQVESLVWCQDWILQLNLMQLCLLILLVV